MARTLTAATAQAIPPAPLARAILAAFASYRRNLDVARDPDEREQIRRQAWTRAANARVRIERACARLEHAA